MPKPTTAETRFLRKIADDGGVSDEAMTLAGDRRPINASVANGWAIEEPWGDGTGRIRHRITVEGCLAMGADVRIAEEAALRAVVKVTSSCGDNSCSARAVNVVNWTSPGSSHAKTFCHPHTVEHIRLVRGHSPQVIPLAEGAFALLADSAGTQVATCQHCGHYIYLYASVARREGNWWRSGEFDETGRCGDAEQRTQTVVHHEPVITVTDRDAALAATTCGRAVGHSVADCAEERAAKPRSVKDCDGRDYGPGTRVEVAADTDPLHGRKATVKNIGHRGPGGIPVYLTAVDGGSPDGVTVRWADEVRVFDAEPGPVPAPAVPLTEPRPAEVEPTSVRLDDRDVVLADASLVELARIHGEARAHAQHFSPYEGRRYFRVRAEGDAALDEIKRRVDTLYRARAAAGEGSGLDDVLAVLDASGRRPVST
ncbi:hypothetical protein OOJ91_12535 [Micromonospora lupini]|uniref:hypothetical protein n=1 Tax=Micromonospora lupini TaxID=285679 RepID=UPI002251E443|nr:hypothetical protein [Micromonospora lupini]MCX5066707.1 hypothetical protein [Micromonospora lupini]